MSLISGTGDRQSRLFAGEALGHASRELPSAYPDTTMMPSMMSATVLTDRFDRALLYATHVHGGQVRKETTIPYIAHVLAVAATVLEYGGSEDMAIAGLLHDAAEDQGGEPRLADIRNRFGDRVADIVHACSDSAAAGEQKDDWRPRKMRYIEHLKTIDQQTLLVSLSDKVHNARSILRNLRKPEIGSAVWSRFGKRPKEDTLWYYRELANAFQGLLPGQLSEELMEIVIMLENE
jgi:(p)ppGpp synthase/HD superfamily hydrolase